jgi:hypothetical protein
MHHLRNSLPAGEEVDVLGNAVDAGGGPVHAAAGVSCSTTSCDDRGCGMRGWRFNCNGMIQCDVVWIIQAPLSSYACQTMMEDCPTGVHRHHLNAGVLVWNLLEQVVW